MLSRFPGGQDVARSAHRKAYSIVGKSLDGRFRSRFGGGWRRNEVQKDQSAKPRTTVERPENEARIHVCLHLWDMVHNSKDEDADICINMSVFLRRDIFASHVQNKDNVGHEKQLI